MKLAELLNATVTLSVRGDPGAELRGIDYDSRRIRPGFLFVAIRGERSDGNAFVPEAVRRGASAVVSELPPSSEQTGVGEVAWVQVPSGRVALADLAARFYGHPTRDLCLVGITGTNGKTTTAHLVEAVFRSVGREVALLGTVGHRGPGFSDPAELTTPEAPDLERRFRSAVDQGATHAVMEVSSHAIAMKRVWGLEFDVAVFTNLSGDHLDFHAGMEDYFQTKRQLFSGLGTDPPRVAAVNRDDPYGSRLLDCGNSRMVTFGLDDRADVHPTEVQLGAGGLTARFVTPGGSFDVSSCLPGRPNLYNVAAAVAVGIGLELEPGDVARGIGALESVPGRFERVVRGQGFEVIVDYAHTDDALRNVLEAVREFTPGRVIVVFGAGGERDQSKRKRMGRVAARCSDRQILTSDNPRGEDPRRIIRMLEEGVEEESGKYSSIPDRRTAISKALGEARPGDTVVIAGKGHEDYQQVGDNRLPFDDRVVAAALLDELNTR